MDIMTSVGCKWIYFWFYSFAFFLLIQTISATIKVDDGLNELNDLQISELSDFKEIDLKILISINPIEEHFANGDGERNVDVSYIHLLQIVYESYYKISLFIVSLIFGIVLDMSEVGAILKTPVGPLISAFCNFIFSPLVNSILMFSLALIFSEKQIVL